MTDPEKASSIENFFATIASIYMRTFNQICVPGNPNATRYIRVNLAKDALRQLKTCKGHEDLAGIKFRDEVFLPDGNIVPIEYAEEQDFTLVDFTPRD